MEIPLLQDIVVILGLSVLIILLFQRIRVPSILGFLITGLIAGPHGLSLIKAGHEVEMLSEIGIIFLLFVIGIEFSLKGLSSIRNTVLWGGTLQVGGTVMLTAFFSYMLGFSLNEAVFLGFLLSLSSTAIVLKMLHEKGEITSPHGRVAVAILIFQDIIVVPMMLVTPLIAGQSDDLFNTLLILALKVILIVVLLGLLAKYLVPYTLTLVVKTKSRELFILTVVGICFATAWLTSSVGLSLALGAFFAGLIISESDYSHQATANILPFREIFVSFFFVSIGMLLDLRFFFENVALILLFTLGVIVMKALVIAVTVMLMRYPPRTVIISALSLFQVGEFAFILSATGFEFALLSQTSYQYFLSISLITMGITPFLMAKASSFSEFLIKARLPSKIRNRLGRIQSKKVIHLEGEENWRDHLVIIGYGINGENLAKAARKANTPYVIVELDPTIFREAKANREPIVFGDASDEVILRHIHVQEARVVVIAISDPAATKKIVIRVREFTQTAHLIVRTRYLREIEEFIKLGADEVIPEEFETSIEIFTRVLKKYLVPYDEIQSFINLIRSHNYDMLRNIDALDTQNGAVPLHIPDMEIITLPVIQGKNRIVGKSILESQLRSQFAITVLAIKRGNQYIAQITPEDKILQDDILYLFGSPANINKLNHYLKM